MRTVFHVLTSFIDPRTGGMEEAILRISGHLASMGRTQVYIYARNESNNLTVNSDFPNILIVPLRADREMLALPLSKQTDLSERYRLDTLLFKNAVERNMAAHQAYRNVIVSFYISSSGFVAQHVASDLQLPHIASVRGTDFSKDFLSPYRLHGIEFVARHANWIITTNLAQERAFRDRLGRISKVKTIYNALPEGAANSLWRPHDRDGIHLVADCGYSFKKATHLLVRATQVLKDDGYPVRLSIVGNDDPDNSDYWKALRSKFDGSEIFFFQNHLDKVEIERFLLNGDIYCSASLGEGCSNSSLLALALGMPIVASRSGCLPDLSEFTDRTMLVPPGDFQSYVEILRTMVQRCIDKNFQLNEEQCIAVRAKLDPKRERYQWENVIADVLPKHDVVAKERQRRVLFFVHDGTGLGHLKRVARLAKAMQGPCACMLVAGHRAASWIVPYECEYMHLPSFDSLLPNKARYWRRVPFLEIEKRQAVEFRRRLITASVSAFQPDAIVVDYLPLGKHEELAEIIDSYDALKYFILRGVLDHPDNVRIDILGGRGEEMLETKYDRILVAADRRICDVTQEYGLSQRLSSKCEYIGYVSDPAPSHVMTQVRAERGLALTDKWVVCSAGGGALGERLIEECLRLTHYFADVQFDIIAGPRTSTTWPFRSTETFRQGNVQYRQECKNLELLHAAADVVVCAGGYNSLVESLEGRARIICFPVQLRSNDEQYLHTQRLQQFYPISLVTKLHELRSALEDNLNHPTDAALCGARSILDFDGIDTFRKIVFEDLGLSSKAAAGG